MSNEQMGESPPLERAVEQALGELPGDITKFLYLETFPERILIRHEAAGGEVEVLLRRRRKRPVCYVIGASVAQLRGRDIRGDALKLAVQMATLEMMHEARAPGVGKDSLGRFVEFGGRPIIGQLKMEREAHSA